MPRVRLLPAPRVPAAPGSGCSSTRRSRRRWGRDSRSRASTGASSISTRAGNTSPRSTSSRTSSTRSSATRSIRDGRSTATSWRRAYASTTAGRSGSRPRPRLERTPLSATGFSVAARGQPSFRTKTSVQGAVGHNLDQQRTLQCPSDDNVAPRGSQSQPSISSGRASVRLLHRAGKRPP